MGDHLWGRGVRVAAALLYCCAALPALAQDWALKEFRFRRAIEITDCPAGCSVLHVSFPHHGALKPDGSDLRVLDASGKTLNQEILRLGPGDQVQVLFDCPTAKPNVICYAYFGSANATTPSAWKAEAGVVLETRRRTEGDGDSWGNFQRMWGNAKEVQGRTLRPKIFDGYNVLGPNTNFLSYYRAHFKVDKPGVHRFCTNSDDASFLLIDGKMICDYPGWHGAGANIGERNGVIDLSAGVHKLEYYHCQGEGETACIAGWQRPGEKHFTLMEENAFVPVGRAKAGSIESADNAARLDFSWAAKDHVVVNGRYMVRMTFICEAPLSGNLVWNFGDGMTLTQKKDKEPVTVTQLYCAPGLYKVTLTREGASETVTQTVGVEPNWEQREEFPEKGWQEIHATLHQRLEKGMLKPEHTAVALAYAIDLDNKKLLQAASALAWKQVANFPAESHALTFYTLGHKLQEELRDYAGSDCAFQEAINSKGDDRIREQAKLHRAGLLIHVFGKDAEAFEILSKLNDALLVPPHEPVLRQIYMADASAGMGKREDAQKRLESLRPIVNLADRAYAIGRRSRLLAVQTYIRRGEYEAAQKELRNIEWETPVERLSDETGMLRAECYIADNDFQHAIVLLNRLIKVNKESARMPEMLFTLMKAYRGAKQTEQMQETFSKLKKEHPYAQETALGAMMVK